MLNLSLIKLITLLPTVLGAWNSKVFAPYVDVTLWPTLNVAQVSQATGTKYFTLAFIVADKANSPSWGGYYNLSQNFYETQINDLRSIGGDVIWRRFW